MEEIKISELTDRCVKYFQEHCYTERRISKYGSLWRTGIIRYMSQKGIESYSQSVGADYVSTCHFHGAIRPQEREKIRSVQVLDDMLRLGYVRKRCMVPVFHSLLRAEAHAAGPLHPESNPVPRFCIRIMMHIYA